MMIPKVERLPPVTVEFLRIVRGVEAVRLRCGGCGAVHVAPWVDLGLSDDSPFPPAGKVWRCGRCGGTDIAATPEPSAERERGTAAPAEGAPPLAPPATVTTDFGAISPELRERLEAVMARLGEADG